MKSFLARAFLSACVLLAACGKNRDSAPKATARVAAATNNNQTPTEPSTPSATTAQTTEPTSAPLAVWWSPNLGLASLNDISERLGKKEPPPAQELSFSKGFPPTEQISISTCSQYLSAKDNGFYPTTNIDEGMESYFMEPCFALRHLENVKPATVSYLDANGWSTSALSILPPFLPAFGVEGSIAKQVEEARSTGQSWQSFDPNLTLQKIDGYTLTAQSSSRRQNYSLTILARGDFNGDGIEDWLVMGYVSNTDGGTFHESSSYVLTQLAPNSIMRIVSETL